MYMKLLLTLVVIFIFSSPVLANGNFPIKLPVNNGGNVNAISGAVEVTFADGTKKLFLSTDPFPKLEDGMQFRVGDNSTLVLGDHYFYPGQLVTLEKKGNVFLVKVTQKFPDGTYRKVAYRTVPISTFGVVLEGSRSIEGLAVIGGPAIDGTTIPLSPVEPL